MLHSIGSYLNDATKLFCMNNSSLNTKSQYVVVPI